MQVEAHVTTIEADRQLPISRKIGRQRVAISPNFISVLPEDETPSFFLVRSRT